jgi:hypothetical protein
MPTCIICEDEKLLREQLKETLAQTWPELIIAGEAEDGMTSAFALLVINIKILLLAFRLRHKWLSPIGYLNRKAAVDSSAFTSFASVFWKPLQCRLRLAHAAFCRFGEYCRRAGRISVGITLRGQVKFAA